MDLVRLKDVLKAFADDPSSLMMEKGRLVVQIQGELISATTSIRDGELFVTEEGQTEMATRWVAQRIAQLDLMADRITKLFSGNSRFVTPSGALLDQVEESPQDDPKPVADALDAAGKFLDRRPGGMCSVLYLTSDAGEGKTTLIGELAHRQAKAYREKKTDWLLVPFGLGGNPFLRLDNVIAAGLLNQLRIRRFYLDGFIHLVRLGYIVPALDGFEEVFVETSGDAVSSLGNLISDMRGEGTLVIAARTAYFEIKRLDRQARLLDSIANAEVGFGRLALNRWGEAEFVRFCELSGVCDGKQLYHDLCSRVGEGHPLLTRAVFVRRIVELAKSTEGVQFLHQLQPEIQDNFRPFIDRIVEREVSEKWIDKQSQPAMPLLTVEEHYELLQLLAEEMWVSKRGSLPHDMSDSLVDIYCETRRKAPSVTRQVRERLITHALLVSDGTGGQLSFDHDHFREFFLGEQLGEYIRTRAAADMRKLLRIDSVPGWTLDSAVTAALRGGTPPQDLLKTIIAIAASEGPTSFVRENSGAICLRLAEKLSPEGAITEVATMTFPEDALAGRGLSNIRFDRCYFRSTVVSGLLSSIRFENCEFEHLELGDDFDFSGVTFCDCQIHGLTVSRGEQAVDWYDPSTIEAYLSRSGAKLERGGQRLLVVEKPLEDDERTKIVRKLIFIFRRCTQTSDSVITKRLGVHASTFFDGMLAELLEVGVLRRVINKGAGNQSRFRLGRSMSAIANALADARGSYEGFRKLIKGAALVESDQEDEEA
jgi:hypothetical protein